MKQTLDWFKHDSFSSESPKFITLRASPYGWAGEGRFWALNGLIARSDECKLDLGRKFAKTAIADKLGMKADEFEAFLTFLRDECELIEYQAGILWTRRLVEDLSEVMVDRERKANTRKRAGADKSEMSADRARTGRGQGADKSSLSADKSEMSADETHILDSDIDTDIDKDKERDEAATRPVEGPDHDLSPKSKASLAILAASLAQASPDPRVRALAEPYVREVYEQAGVPWTAEEEAPF